ncbi:NAD-dependent succinate-semialdehyde dehydrogenase [Sneathiella glossodoripedis]|uniref:NAD-dependent succinate-semialdehyde dehydrogenase n=1 Tax=Sneathiella glossodoripedis TaxID=418853 RepID=UPI00046E689D|nr:NAD-dependent succinate-semialdehyde dehydrogenase [Sneathiella glossodoripedis]
MQQPKFHDAPQTEAVTLSAPSLFKQFSYINGEWRNSDNGQVIEVFNPANKGLIGYIAALGRAESLESIAAAQSAFDDWASLLPQERSVFLRRWNDLIQEHKEDLAQIMSFEQGKPLSECRGEIDYGADFIEFYGEEAKRPNIESVTSHLKGAEIELWREPAGVAALVTPWNFPSAMITRKAAAALAAGCTVVVHPSQETPYSAIALAELADRAGFPKGVFNVVTGHAPDIVGPWTEDTRVRVLSFTGSTEIGRLLYSQCAPSIKRLVMELGGHAPFIVFDDANLKTAVDCAISAKFATSGQDCLAANRFYIARPIYEEFCNLFIEATSKLRVGAGPDDPDIGPLIHERAVQKQEAQIEDAVSKGARLALGGKRLAPGSLFFEPTVLLEVPDDAAILHEETFGPIAAITPFDHEEDVTQRANATEYGLIAYVHTKNPRRIYRTSRALQFGMVAINRTKVTGAPIPFGGVKQSGLGREGARQGLEEFTEIKYVCRDYEVA